MTISVGIFNGKGGVTKSTIARALAVAYAKAGWNVCLIDMDVLNGTVTRWVQRRMANNIEPAIAAQPCGTPSQVQKIIESEVYDLVIVDGGAYASESVPKLSEFLDMVILPTRFSTDDLETTVNTAHGIVKKGVPIKKICMVFSGAAENEADYIEAQEYLANTPYFVVDKYIPHKPALSKAQDKGLSLIECSYVAPRKKADDVIQGIINQLEALTTAE